MGDSQGSTAIDWCTKEHHVREAAEAARVELTKEEIANLEQLADATGVDTRGSWEQEMV